MSADIGLQPPYMAPPSGPTPTDDAVAALFRQAKGITNTSLSPVAGGPRDPYADDKKLLATFDACKREALDNRWVYERGWWRNLLYLLGRHWIYYDTQRGQWIDKRLAKWIPRPVTNKVAETHQTILSLFEAVDLIAKVRPTGNQPADISAAEVADKMEPAIRDEHCASQMMRMADFWLIALGNVFLHPWWDKNAEGATTIHPFVECAGCGLTIPPGDVASQLTTGQPGVCQQCGMRLPSVPSTLAYGKGRTDVCSPLEIACPAGYNEFPLAPYVIRLRWRTKRWIEQFDSELAKKLTFSSSTSERSLQLLRSLATQSDISSSPLAVLAGSGMEQSDGVTECELWLKPTKEYPQGLFLRVMDDSSTPVVVRDKTQSLPGPLPYDTPEGDLLWPWIHEPYERIGGRLWGRAPLDSIIQKNDQLNQLDSLWQLIVQRTSNPVWLEPKGSEVKKFSGEPGLVVRYNPLIAAGNAKPERIEGSNVPGSVINLRMQLLTDIEMLAGVQDVLKGAKPAGADAFSAMQLLVERAQSRFGMVLSERGEAYRQWYTLALELERAYGPDSRFFSIIGPSGTWQGQQFKRADLPNAISVIIEDGSQAPKTNLGKRASITQLQQIGIINPTDPDQTYSILRVFGQQELLPALDADVKSALQEQDAFERWAASVPPPPPTSIPGAMPMAGAMPGAMGGVPTSVLAQQSPLQRKPWHQDAIHFSEHRKWALTDAIRQLFAGRADLEELFVIHMAVHEQAAMATAQGAPKFAPPTPPAAPPQAPGIGQAMVNSNRESGNPGDASREIAQGTEGLALA